MSRLRATASRLRPPLARGLQPARGLRLWREWTLRTRLVVSIAVLSAVALVVANTVGVLFLRSYLISRVDRQISLQARADQARVASGTFLFNQLPRPRNGLGQDFRVLAFASDGTQFAMDTGFAVAPNTTDSTGPKLGSWDDLRSHRDRGPYTVAGYDGTPWRVMAYSLGHTDLTGVSGVSLRDVESTSTNLIAIDSAVAGLLLLMLVLAASSVVRIGLRPLTRMEHTAAEIVDTDDLARRVTDVDPHTEPGRLGSALNAMLSRVEAAVHARTASEQRLRQFLADASHELRTPLTSIQGFAELYRRGGTPPGPELDEAMGRIESEVGRMRLLVNDLLLLARLDEERPLARHPVDLLGVAAETVRDAHIRVPTRFVQLAALDDASDTFEPVTVIGDAERLRQVATNLVSNALQHTGDNTRIVVRVGRSRVAALSGSGPMAGDAVTGDPSAPAAFMGRELPPDVAVAVLEVADTGPGMERVDAERVFERLFRTERSRDRRHGGAGLGLAIVAAIVQAHGGRVELMTAPGAGSRFRVLLPAQATDPGDELMAGDLDEADDATDAADADGADADDAADVHGADDASPGAADTRVARATDADSQLAPSDP
jgi:two-component system OmpR family sensor kinase